MAYSVKTLIFPSRSCIFNNEIVIVVEWQRASTRTLLGFRVGLSIASRHCLPYEETTSTIERSLFVETRFRYVSVSQLYCFEIADDIGCGQPRVTYRQSFAISELEPEIHRT